MSILIVSAHPDDETIGMGGLLKKLSRNYQIKVLFLADGITARKKSGYLNVPKYEVLEKEKKKMLKEIEQRKKDAKKALKLLGINKMSFLDYPDNELDTIPFLKIVKDIENEIKQTKCTTIFTHHHDDLNIDHRIVYEASITAARPVESTVNSIISFESVSSSDWRYPHKFNPNLFVDITEELPIKLKAVKMYKNEIRRFPHPRSLETIEYLARRWGSLYGFRAAEAFETIMIRTKSLKL